MERKRTIDKRSSVIRNEYKIFKRGLKGTKKRGQANRLTDYYNRSADRKTREREQSVGVHC